MGRKTRALLIATGANLLFTLGAALWIRAVFDQLPDQIATHWGVTGPDSFVPRAEAWGGLPFTLVLAVAVGVVLVIALPDHGRNMNLAAGIGTGLGFVVTAVSGGTVALQAGRPPDDPLLTQALWLIPALLGSVPLGILGARLVGTPPPRPDATRVPQRAARLNDKDRRRSWSTTVDMPAGMSLILVLPVVIFVIIGVGTRSWGLPVTLTVLLALLLAGMWRWRLAIDDHGLTCRGLFGWPAVRHELREIEEAEALDFVGAFTYGGPGLRATSEGERLAIRGGPALRLALSDGTDFIVTTPDADVAARLLNTLLAESRQGNRSAR